MTFARSDAVALAPVAPAVSAVATVAFFLLDWPDDSGLQCLAGVGVGLAVWLLAAQFAAGDITGPASASAETYEELRARIVTLEARAEAIKQRDARLGEGDTQEARAEAIRQRDARLDQGDTREALAEVEALIRLLKGNLSLDKDLPVAPGSPYRWLRGHGYMNAWRALHHAEDLLVVAEPREVVYKTGITNLERLTGSSLVTPTVVTPLVKEVGAAVGTQTAPAATKTEVIAGRLVDLLTPPQNATATHAREHVLAEADTQWARTLIREAGFRIHAAQNAAWDQLVNLRNRLLSALVLAVLVTYALIALLVLVPVDRDAMIAGVAFFLVGAVVGIFNELYQTSRRRKGTIFDYGLGQVRLAATPVLSGIAGVGGVLVSNLAGPLLLVEPPAGGSDAETSTVASAALSDIFSIPPNGAGLVVAAVFGLTPGLLLTRLRDRTDDYKVEIERLTASPLDASTDGTGS